MDSKHASFYSCKAGRTDTVKGHRTRTAAEEAAGEMGQIWVAAEKRQYQVHRRHGGGWVTVDPEPGWFTDLRSALVEKGLIDA